MTALRIEDTLGAYSVNSSATPMERLLVALCEATMWMMKEWPNELDQHGCTPSSSASSGVCCGGGTGESPEASVSRQRSVLSLRDMLQQSRPPRQTPIDGLILLLADSVQLLADQWPPYYRHTHAIAAEIVASSFHSEQNKAGIASASLSSAAPTVVSMAGESSSSGVTSFSSTASILPSTSSSCSSSGTAMVSGGAPLFPFFSPAAAALSPVASTASHQQQQHHLHAGGATAGGGGGVKSEPDADLGGLCRSSNILATGSGGAVVGLHQGGSAAGGSGGAGGEGEGGHPTTAHVDNEEVMRQFLLYSSGYSNPEDDVFRMRLKDDLREEEEEEVIDVVEAPKKKRIKAPPLSKTVTDEQLKERRLKRKKKRRAFEFYWEERRGDYAKTHSHLGHNERRAIAQQEWRSVTNREKWQQMADDYNVRMHEEKYRNKPKPPVTANAFFFKEHHKRLREENPGMRGCDVLAEIGRMWERTTDRQRYIDMQNEDRKRYETEVAIYKIQNAVAKKFGEA